MKRKNETESSSSDEEPKVLESKIVASLLRKLSTKKPLTSKENEILKQFITKPAAATNNKKRELNESVIGVEQLPKKNIYSFMWSLILTTCYVELKQTGVTYDEIINNSDIFSDTCYSIIRNVHDVCQKLNLFQTFWYNFNTNYKIIIIINETQDVSSPCLKNEPIFAAFTPEFTASDSESDDELSTRKRNTFLIINMLLIRKLFEQYQHEISTPSGDSGVFFVSSNLDEKRKCKQFYKVLLALTMHALGHFELFTKHGYCYYETHKQVSQFQIISSIFN